MRGPPFQASISADAAERLHLEGHRILLLTGVDVVEQLATLGSLCCLDVQVLLGVHQLTAIPLPHRAALSGCLPSYLPPKLPLPGALHAGAGLAVGRLALCRTGRQPHTWAHACPEGCEWYDQDPSPAPCPCRQVL